jgi:hypothetical protein
VQNKRKISSLHGGGVNFAELSRQILPNYQGGGGVGGREIFSGHTKFFPQHHNFSENTKLFPDIS